MRRREGRPEQARNSGQTWWNGLRRRYASDAPNEKNLAGYCLAG